MSVLHKYDIKTCEVIILLRRPALRAGLYRNLSLQVGRTIIADLPYGQVCIETIRSNVHSMQHRPALRAGLYRNFVLLEGLRRMCDLPYGQVCIETILRVSTRCRVRDLPYGQVCIETLKDKDPMAEIKTCLTGRSV